MQAMIFAAGLGTRLRPLTDTRPKALVEVGGKTLLARVVENLKSVGAGRIVVNVHHFASQIVDYLRANDNFGVDIIVSDETSGLLDTGGGIKKAAKYFSSDFPILIHNVDIISNVDLAKFYSCAEGRDALLLVSGRKTQRYLLFGDDMNLKGWTNIATGEVRTPYENLNKDACKMLAFAGIHAISPRLLTLMEPMGDKFGIMDFYLKVCRDSDIVGYEKTDLRLMDVGKAETLALADAFARSEDARSAEHTTKE